MAGTACHAGGRGFESRPLRHSYPRFIPSCDNATALAEIFEKSFVCLNLCALLGSYAVASDRGVLLSSRFHTTAFGRIYKEQA